MAFIAPGGNVISFADFEDVTSRDQRVFEANEGLTEVIVEDLCERATERILAQLRATEWWKSYYIRQTGAIGSDIVSPTGIVVPPVNPNRIQDRKADFTDLCVYYTLSELIYPRVADFSVEDNSERAKIGFYNEKYRSLFMELIADGSWYDFDGSGAVTINEKAPSRPNLVRVR